MYKKLLFAAALILAGAANQASAQLEMEQGTVNIALKTGGLFLQKHKFNKPDGSNNNFNFHGTTPAIGASFEMAFWDNISIGCDINYAKYKTDEKGIQPGPAATGYHTYGNMNVLAFLFNVKYFTPIKISKLATYARVDVLPFAVFDIHSDTDYSTGASSLGGGYTGIKMTYGVYAGGDWELTRTLGAYAEVGYGYTLLNLGIRVTPTN